MPNWVANVAYVKHKDRAQLQRAYHALEKGNLFNEFIPIPEVLLTREPGSDQFERELVEKYGADEWYTWCLNNWGIKWDVGEPGHAHWIDHNMLALTFESPWDAPLEAYHKLEELGFEILAYYYEPGMTFAGIYEDGLYDHYSDWSDSQQAREILPAELDDTFGISDDLEEIEREQMDDLHRWIEDGARARRLEVTTSGN